MKSLHECHYEVAYLRRETSVLCHKLAALSKARLMLKSTAVGS